MAGSSLARANSAQICFKFDAILACPCIQIIKVLPAQVQRRVWPRKKEVCAVCVGFRRKGDPRLDKYESSGRTLEFQQGGEKQDPNRNIESDKAEELHPVGEFLRTLNVATLTIPSGYPGTVLGRKNVLHVRSP